MSNENPINTLIHEHKYILKVVHAFSVIDDDLSQDKQVNVDQMRKIVLFMREFADKCHHAKEETILFPAMENKGVPKTGCPLAALRAEHVKGRQLVAALESANDAYSGGNLDAVKDIRSAMSGIRQLYPNHIWKEDEMVFPMADRLFSEDELADLEKDFREAGNEFEKDYEHFKAFANEMEKLHG